MNDELAATVRVALKGKRGVREIKMFGGIGFMLNNNLLVAASRRGLLVRVGKEGYGEALLKSDAQPMVMRGRTMEGYIRVAGKRLEERAVASWVELAVAFVKTLPPKISKPKPNPRKRLAKKPAKLSSRRRVLPR